MSEKSRAAWHLENTFSAAWTIMNHQAFPQYVLIWRNTTRVFMNLPVTESFQKSLNLFMYIFAQLSSYSSVQKKRISLNIANSYGLKMEP